MLELPILSICIFLPLLSSLYITFFISQSKSPNKQIYAMYVVILSSIFTLISTIYLLIKFDNNSSAYQFVERYKWVEFIGLEYYVGIDGISLYFIFLTALLTLICIIGSLFTIKKQIKEFLLCFLLLESFCIGAFSSLNLLLFFLFFEVILIPMYIIIGAWGGENRIYSAIKFFIYTFFGSLFFLLALIYIYNKTGTFNMLELSPLISSLALKVQKVLWLATFIAFAVKVPMLPFHTWLPDAHVEAPTAGSVMLAGILLKLGAYGFIRISILLMPEPSKIFAIYILILSAGGVVYGSLVAMAQTNMKKMIAYSSIAHMGYVTGGIFSFTIEGIKGAVFQMISHGLVSSALFLIVGILYERNHTKEINQYGGVASKMPLLATLFMISVLGSIGLPGTSGFIGEFFSLIGIFKVNNIAAIVASIGLILTALYMLKLYKKIMFGEITNSEVLNFSDLKNYEFIALIPLIILIVYLGILPESVMKTITLAVEPIVKIYNPVEF